MSDTFVAGDIVGDANSFDGIRKLIPVAQTVDQAANGAAITLPRLDELIDKVKPGKPDVLLMSRRTRRGLKWLWTQYRR